MEIIKSFIAHRIDEWVNGNHVFVCKNNKFSISLVSIIITLYIASEQW